MTKKVKLIHKKMTIDGDKKDLIVKVVPILDSARADIKEKVNVFVKAVDDAPEGEGIIEAYVSVFGNVDSYGDIVEKGAFSEAVKAFNENGRYPKGIWAHDWSMPISKTLEMREDERGLYIRGQLILTVEKAREAWDLIKAGVITDFSFGYEINDAEFDDRGFRHLKRVTIYEWSPVLVGANNQATIISAKSADTDVEVSEEEKEVPTDTPDPEHPDAVVPPTSDTPPTDPPAGDPPKPEGEGGDIEGGIEEKAGRVLSAKNVSLVKEAMDQIKEVTSALDSIYTNFEALISAVESSSALPGDEKNGVDQPSKDEVKYLIRGVRRVVNEGTKTLVRLKKMQ